MKYQGGSMPELETPESRRNRGNTRTPSSKVGRPHNNEELLEVQREMIRDGIKNTDDTEEIECPKCGGQAESYYYESLETIYAACKDCGAAFEDGEEVELQ